MSYSEFQDEKSNHFTEANPAQQPSYKVVPTDVLISDSNEESMISNKNFFNLLCMVRFFCILIFNYFPIYFVALGKETYDFIDAWKHNPKIKKSSLFVCYFVDSYLNCSIIATYLWFFYCLKVGHQLQPSYKVYENWGYNSIILINLFTVCVSYKEGYLFKIKEIDKAKEQSEKNESPILEYKFNFTWAHLVRPKTFQSMSLGHLLYPYLKNIEITEEILQTQLKKQFKKEFKKIKLKDNVDPTFGYFCLIKDQKISEKKWYKYNPNQSLRNKTGIKVKNFLQLANTGRSLLKSKSTLETLHQLGFQGERKIKKNFLLPQFLGAAKFSEVNWKHNWLAAFLIVMMKVGVPTIILVKPWNLEILYFSLVFTGFYLHFAPVIFDLVKNDDIKKRHNIIKKLKKLIDIQEYMANQEKPNKQDNEILDISCALSLQSWDNMRHITLQLDKHVRHSINYTFWSIALYGKLCFVLILLCLFDLPFMKSINYCDEAIIFYNMHVDLVFIAMISIKRIYAGSEFNESFETIHEQIQRLTAVYEDLFTLFDFYFTHGIEQQIENSCYQSVIKLIKQYAEIKVLEEEPGQVEEDKIDSGFLSRAREKVEEMKESMQKIQESTEKDVHKCTERFLGIYESRTNRIMKIVFLVLISFLPGVFKKMEKYFNEMA